MMILNLVIMSLFLLSVNAGTVNGGNGAMKFTYSFTDSTCQTGLFVAEGEDAILVDDCFPSGQFPDSCMVKIECECVGNGANTQKKIRINYYTDDVCADDSNKGGQGINANGDCTEVDGECGDVANPPAWITLAAADWVTACGACPP